MSSVDDKSFRKKVYYKIKKNKKKDVFHQIHSTLIKHKQHFDVNSNGVWFDIYKISIKCVNDINKILDENKDEVEDSITYTNYSEDVTEDNKKDIIKTNIDKVISHSIL